MLFKQCIGGTRIWFTIDPLDANLSPRTLKNMKQVVEVIKEHAEFFWGYDA